MIIRFILNRVRNDFATCALEEVVSFTDNKTIYSRIKITKTDDVYIYDQFNTKEFVAKECLKLLSQSYRFEDYDLIIEPSAGTGSFFNNLPADNRLAIEIDKDLCRANPKYINKSFFDFEPSKQYKKVIVVGNPPFGTQNKLSVDFFNHAAKFSEVIAFIIPRTWNKQSIHDRLDKRFHLIKSVDLLEEPFEGVKSTNVKCCFQIWEKRNKLREKVKKILSHEDWEFLPYLKKGGDLFPPQDADFVILAYGSNPGQVSVDLFKWRPKSVHFIKSNLDKEKLIKRFESLDYSCADNSARQSSLCKSDLVKLYTERFGS